MSTDSPEVSRSLPVRSNLRHLKNQAKDLLKAGDAASIAEAQFKIARLYGFASWPKRATLDQSGIGGQTPIFHAVTQFGDWGLPVVQLLIDRGADLSVRVRLP